MPLAQNFSSPCDMSPVTHPRAARPPRMRASTDKDQPLIDDIRLLGRMLGDVIREQEGQAAFDLIEQMRQLSVAFRRHADQRPTKPEEAAQEPERRPDGERDPCLHLFQPPGQSGRRPAPHPPARRARARRRRAGRQPGNEPATPARRRASGHEDIEQALAHSHVSPVLTAHPTEVQRKSILDAERAIARLLAERDAPTGLSARERADNEGQMRARVVQLWQTRLLRFTKLTVADEIENALSYYQATFLNRFRASTATWKTVCRRPAVPAGATVPAHGPVDRW
jgi:phosphoenolpyruvate carboxylase